MDGVKLQAKLHKGYGKAALRLGLDFDHYRPVGVNNPLDPSNKLGTLKASFTPRANQFNYDKSSDHKNALWHGLFDGSAHVVGDYMVGESTYFIAAKQPILPMLCIECNRTLTIKRPADRQTVGQLPYGGNTELSEQTLLLNWPASVLREARGEYGDVQLPGDVKSPSYLGMMPFNTVVIQPFDIAIDDLGRRYIISTSELTDLGWRLGLNQAVT